MSVGRRRKHLLHDTPSEIERAYSPTATIATTSTNTAGVTSQAMSPIVPMRQNVNASRSYFSGRLSGGADVAGRVRRSSCAVPRSSAAAGRRAR